MVILSYPDHLHSGYSDAGGIEFAEEGLLYGNLQLLVPETEDDRTEEGSKDCVGDDHQSIAFLRVETLGLEVDDRCKAIVHNDHNKMRRTGGEGFVPALGWRDPQDGGHDEGVRQEDEEKATQQSRDTHNAHPQGYSWYIISTG